MPVLIPAAAGKLYRPSNGTEGEMFMHQFCARCQNDSEDRPCEILGRSFVFDTRDDEYPREWRYDDRGAPLCTAFSPSPPDEEKKEVSEAGWRINMVCCTDVICNEVAHKEVTQRDVALSYALAIKSQMQGADKPDWSRINRAILDRWSMAGLERIKKGAYDLCTGKATPETLMRRNPRHLSQTEVKE